MKNLRLLLIVMFGLGVSAQAHAHATSTSFLEVDSTQGEAVQLRWDLSLHDLVWSVFIDSDYDGIATWQEVLAARPSLTQAVLAQLRVARGGHACVTQVGDLAMARRAEQNFVAIRLSARCPQAGPLVIDGPLFMTGDPSQRVLLTFTRSGERHTGVISPSAPAWREPERISAWRSFARFIGEGMWHVLIGFDHIAFILLLLLPSVVQASEGRWMPAPGAGQVWRDLLTIVTAFTVAHSTTLALAVTDTVMLPAKPVELAIAASIAVAAIVNLLPRLARLRLPLAFAFGLVHGFGFANVLGELDRTGRPSGRCWPASTSAWSSLSWASWRWCCPSSTTCGPAAGTRQA